MIYNKLFYLILSFYTVKCVKNLKYISFNKLNLKNGVSNITFTDQLPNYDKTVFLSNGKTILEYTDEFGDIIQTEL
jgi:hypothetical protein